MRSRALPMLLLLTACTPAAVPTGGGLAATLEPATGGSGRVVTAVLTADQPVEVRAVRLRGAGFAQVPAQPVSGRAGPQGVRVPVTYGPVLCAGAAAPTVVEVTTATGTVDAPVGSDSLLPGLRASECAR